MFQGDCQLPCLSVLPFSLFSSGVVSFAILLGGGRPPGGFQVLGSFRGWGVVVGSACRVSYFHAGVLVWLVGCRGWALLVAFAVVGF